MIVETELTIADSIAIKILQGGAIIRGVGNELHLNTQNTNKTRVLLQKLRAKVHGIAGAIIRSSIGRLIVHGEKECMLLQYKLEDEEYSFEELYRFQITDWISSATFLKDPNEFIILTSHSVVLRMLYDEKAAKHNLCRITAKLSSSDKSTLYCSHIHGNVFEELVIFGGNAFGELLIWNPSKEHTISNNSNDCIEVKLKRRISAHNGVIFSIDFNDKFNILTTTSDDRSIRFWKRENVSSNDLIDFNVIPIASGYGHVARVFQGKIIHSGGQPFALTVGEDSFVCLWKANADLVFKKRLHFGAIIWNFEYDLNTHTLYTVGSTGNLLAYNLEDALENKIDNFYTKTLTGLDTQEYVAKAKFLKSNIIIGVTNKNRLLYTRVINAIPDYYGPWQILKMHKSYKCTVLEVHDNYVVICGYKRLTLLKYSGEDIFETLFDDHILDGVIRAFNFLSNSTFLVSDDAGKCLFLGGENLQLRIPVPLPHCKEPWITSSLQIQTYIKKMYLVISNRMGNILLFDLKVDHAKCVHLTTLRQPHGALGATMLRVQEVCNKQIFIQSAGHDGSLKSYAITIESDTINLNQRVIVPIAWVEHLINIKNTEHVLGFNDNHFVVWSQQHDFLVQVPCGGGHRSWHYSIITDGSGTKFMQLLFIKNKEMRLHKIKLFNVPVEVTKLLRNEWHTRSCNVLKSVEQLDCRVPYTITISAGDDNMVKISKLMSDKQLVLCAELHSHISNVRTVKVLQVHTDELLIFTGGGRAQLCITRLNLKSFRLQELLNYIVNKSDQNKDGRVHSYQADPETRIMACDVVKISNDNSDVDIKYFIFLCCSDGYLRKVHVNKFLEVVSEEAKYYGCCLLQIKTIDDLYMITAGTDGNLRFFDFNLDELPIRLSHHASGVNAMDIMFDSDTSIVHILTGGDDQSISYTSLEWRNGKTFQIKKEFHLANAHSAQVTAVQLFYNDNMLCAYTSGLDQILNLIDIHTQELNYICHTCVADTKGLVVDSLKRCFVYGCGIQIFKMKR